MFREPSGRWRTVLSRVTEPGHYLVRSGRSRSRHYELAVITIPKLESVRFRVTPPAYTRRPVYEGPLPENGLSGLPGAKVRLWAKSNRVLAGGKLVIAGDGTNDGIALRPTGTRSDEVSGEFEIHASGKFEISVTDEADHDSPDRLAGSITLLHDDKPFVRDAAAADLARHAAGHAAGVNPGRRRLRRLAVAVVPQSQRIAGAAARRGRAVASGDSRRRRPGSSAVKLRTGTRRRDQAVCPRRRQRSGGGERKRKRAGDRADRQPAGVRAACSASGRAWKC